MTKTYQNYRREACDVCRKRTICLICDAFKQIETPMNLVFAQLGDHVKPSVSLMEWAALKCMEYEHQ